MPIKIKWSFQRPAPCVRHTCTSKEYKKKLFIHSDEILSTNHILTDTQDLLTLQDEEV